MRSLMLVVGLLFSFNLFAEELKLAVITSDIDQEIRDFYLITNDKNEVDSVRYVAYLPSGQILEDVTVPAERVIQEGTVVVERDGRDAVRLEADANFDVAQGGYFQLNYLYSGVTGTRRVHRLMVKKVGDMWFLKDLKDQPVNRILVLGNWNRVLGLIGIREIQTSYKH